MIEISINPWTVIGVCLVISTIAGILRIAIGLWNSWREFNEQEDLKEKLNQ